MFGRESVAVVTGGTRADVIGVVGRLESDAMITTSFALSIVSVVAEGGAVVVSVMELEEEERTLLLLLLLVLLLLLLLV